ncbi:hypothetical protein EVA_13471 [gut metagenome]|uniref:Uncharacterized protein n=1 Tax=gut metagenome TaxID=749906 RepID=J9G9G2_9ZZZZ
MPYWALTRDFSPVRKRSRLQSAVFVFPSAVKPSFR